MNPRIEELKKFIDTFDIPNATRDRQLAMGIFYLMYDLAIASNVDGIMAGGPEEDPKDE